MLIVGVGLVKLSQTWDILLIYCSNQFKKYIPPLLTLARGGTLHPLLLSMSEAFSDLFPLSWNSATQTLLSDQAWSLIPKLNLLLWRSRIRYCSPYAITYILLLTFTESILCVSTALGGANIKDRQTQSLKLSEVMSAMWRILVQWWEKWLPDWSDGVSREGCSQWVTFNLTPGWRGGANHKKIRVRLLLIS